jgi:hypothetical protein
LLFFDETPPEGDFPPPLSLGFSFLSSLIFLGEVLSSLLLLLLPAFIDVLPLLVVPVVLLEEPSRLVSCNVSKPDWNDCLRDCRGQDGSLPVAVGTSVILAS